MSALVASSVRSHGGVELKFVDKAPATVTDTRAVVEHLVIPNRVAFWFKNTHYCRLCNVIHGSPSQHFHMGVEARSHAVREIFLSYWLEEDAKGVYTGSSRWMRRLEKQRYDALGREIVKQLLREKPPTSDDGASDQPEPKAAAKQRRFAEEQTLRLDQQDLHFRSRIFAGRTVSPDFKIEWAESIVSMPPLLHRRCAYMRRVLQFLRDVHVLGPSLVPARATEREREYHKDKGGGGSVGLANENSAVRRMSTKTARNTARFEGFEYVGDSSWGFNAAARLVFMMPHRDWTSSAHAWAWGFLRDGIESNTTLTMLGEMLRVDELLPEDIILGGGKPLADIVEAVVGELQCGLAMLLGPRAPVGGLGQLHALSLGEGALGRDQKAIQAVLKFAVEEICDLAALIYCFHFAPQPHMEPFLRELIFMNAQFTLAPAVQHAKSQRPHATRRLRRIGVRGTPMLAPGEFSFIRQRVFESPMKEADVADKMEEMWGENDKTSSNGNNSSSSTSSSSTPSLQRRWQAFDNHAKQTSTPSGGAGNKHNSRASILNSRLVQNSSGSFRKLIKTPFSAMESFASGISSLIPPPRNVIFSPILNSLPSSSDSASVDRVVPPEQVYRFEHLRLLTVPPVDESRIYNAALPFKTSETGHTGDVPSIVKAVDQKRSEEMAKRIKQRRKRAI